MTSNVRVSLAERLRQSILAQAKQCKVLIAGIRVCFIGIPELLNPMTQALAHLPSFCENSDVEVHLLSNLPDSLELHDQVQWLTRQDAEFAMLFDPFERVALMQLTLPIKTHLQCAPCLHILRAILEQHQVSVLHAAAIGTKAGAVLLIGRGGSGKSTTALLALRSGFSYLADDYCAVAIQPQPTVYSLFSSAKFHFDNPLTSFLEQRHNPDLEKGYAMLYPKYQTKLLEKAPIRAVVLPRLGETLGLQRISAGSALLALAPSTLFQLGTRKEELSFMAALLRLVPSYALNLGDEPSAIPDVLETLLAT